MTVALFMPSGSPVGFVAVSFITPGHTQDASFLGFFGSGGPSNSVAVGSYQEETWRTDKLGNDEGKGLNNKFVNSTTIEISGVSRSLPLAAPSGCLVCRLTTGGDVQTQNGRLYAVNLNASSGATLGEAPDNITTQLAEIVDDGTWTDVSADGTNFLTFTNKTVTTDQHDFFAAVSVKPLTAGTKSTFGFHFQVEYF